MAPTSESIGSAIPNPGCPAVVVSGVVPVGVTVPGSLTAVAVSSGGVGVGGGLQPGIGSGAASEVFSALKNVVEHPSSATTFQRYFGRSSWGTS